MDLTRFRHWNQKQHTPAETPTVVFMNKNRKVHRAKVAHCPHRRSTARWIQRQDTPLNDNSMTRDRRRLKTPEGKNIHLWNQETKNPTGSRQQQKRSGNRVSLLGQTEAGNQSKKQCWKVRHGAQTIWQGPSTKPRLKYKRTQVSLIGWGQMRE